MYNMIYISMYVILDICILLYIRMIISMIFAFLRPRTYQDTLGVQSYHALGVYCVLSLLLEYFVLYDMIRLQTYIHYLSYD